MTGFKSKIFAALFCFCAINDAAAQDEIYLVPPVHLLPLKKMETDGYGLTVADKTDILNENVWQNAVYSLVTAKFSQIADTLPAKAEELRLTLLKLTAKPPQGSTGQAFVTLKLQTLFDRGQSDDAYKLIQKIPEKTRTEAQNKIYANVLLTRDLQTACALPQQESGESFWLYLSAVCAAAGKDEDKAFLALDLLKEQGASNAFISAAVDHFLYQKPLSVVPEEISPLTAAVWRAGGHDLIELKDESGQIWYKAMVARDETIPVEKRLAVAEELVQKGVLPASKLRTYYQQASFKEFKKAPLPPELQRAQAIQQAAALSSQAADNLKKQSLIKQGFLSAKKARLSYAFAATAKDIMETLTPDLDTLAESADLIEAFTLAGLNEQALDWQKKAEMLFPKSETTARGWYFAELAQSDKNKHFFIPALENMMAYAENKNAADKEFIAKIDRLMLTFKTLDMIRPDESWHYTSFAEESAEDEFLQKEKKAVAKNKPVGNTVLEALRELNGTYTGLLNALSTLVSAGLEREAAVLAVQSMDLILTSGQTHE